ncbi:ABC transporter permease [Vibrio sp.]|uniref:ABC transporter permease n=1 Tax=Vibrio sp. TaxID=678 RepID=UPI003D0E0FE2
MPKSLVSQWLVLRHDKWLLASLTWIPVGLAIMIGWIFSAAIATELPIGVVDLQHSVMSQKLVRYYDASPTLDVQRHYQDATQAKQAMVSGDIYAYVVIPHQLDKGVYSGQTPQISAYYNSQYILTAKLISSALLRAQGTFNAELAVAKQLAKGDTDLAAAAGRAVTVQTQITALFNQNSNYAQFLVSAIIPALWQIMVVASTILILAAHQRYFGLQRWLGNVTPLLSLAKTLAWYLPVYLLQGAAFLCWFYWGMDWPMQGQLWPMLLGLCVTAIAAMIMACLFFFLSLDPARALSFAGAFTAPSFAFLGITFPVSDMPALAQFWRSLLPVSHYIELQVSQASYGVTAWQSLQHLLPLAGFVLPLAVTALLLKRALYNEPKRGATA